MAHTIEESRPVSLTHVRTCLRCGDHYDWRRSPSSGRRMTYCGALCESADRGFTLETAVHRPHRVRPIFDQVFAA